MWTQSPGLGSVIVSTHLAAWIVALRFAGGDGAVQSTARDVGRSRIVVWSPAPSAPGRLRCGLGFMCAGSPTHLRDTQKKTGTFKLFAGTGQSEGLTERLMLYFEDLVAKQTLWVRQQPFNRHLD